MIRTFIQVAGLAFTLEAAFFLARANVGLSAEHIAELASTKWDYSPDVIRGLAQQRADTTIGFSFLLAAFVLSLWNTLWPMRWVDFTVHKGAAAYALALAVFVGFGAFHLSKELTKTHEQLVKEILDRPTTPGVPQPQTK
jgi:hypothetical protein